MITREDIGVAEAAGREALLTLVEALASENATLRARIKELEDRLNRDSHNSHQPPSSDGPAKRPRPRSLRKRSGTLRESGGQPGHPGATRCLVDDPDVVIAHVPIGCAGCGEDGRRFRLRNEFFAPDGQLAARVSTTGGWLNLAARKLTAPPEAVAAALAALARSDDYVVLPPRASQG